MPITPRILFLTCHLPWPMISGGRRREFELLRRLSQYYEMHLCVVSKTHEDPAASVEVLLEHCADVHVFAAEDYEAQSGDARRQHPCQVLLNYSSDAAGYVAEMSSSGAISAIHVEGFYLMRHIPASNVVPVLLTEQNIEYTIWEQRASYATDRTKRAEYQRQAQLTKAAELVSWEAATLCVVLTEEDRRCVLQELPNKEVRVVPDGVDHASEVELTDTLSPEVRGEGAMLLFVGNFDYEPNVDAVTHLCRDIFPLIRKAVPDVRLHLVGNDPHSRLRPFADLPGVIVTSRVSSLAPYYKAADVFLCPLRVGGGVKVKMLEALSYGKAIVSSSVGVRGLPTVKGSHLYIEDRGEDFAAGIVHLLRHPEEKARLEAAVSTILPTLPSWEDAALELGRCYGEVMNLVRSMTAPGTSVLREGLRTADAS